MKQRKNLTLHTELGHIVPHKCTIFENNTLRGYYDMIKIMYKNTFRQ